MKKTEGGGMPDGQTALHYFSTVRGVTEEGPDSPIVYYGASWRIPKAAMRSLQTMQHEFEVMEDLVRREFADKKFPVGGIVERYEVFDIETGEMIVMCRIPYIYRERTGA